MTHRELVDIGANFLLNSKNWFYRCPYVVKEIHTYCLERPDIFGLNDFNILIEVKVNYADFKKDFTKHFRMYPEKGMGAKRYYLCPEGLIKIEELPDKWGLLYCDENKKISVIKECELFDKFNEKGEQHILKSIIRRLTENKRQIFDFRK